MENAVSFNENNEGQLSFGDINNLEVVKMSFIDAKSLTWRALFSGFDTLYAITYSSSIDFVCELLELFSKAEIIFGFEGAISYSLSEVLAFQSKTIEELRNTNNKSKLNLINRIKDDSLRLYVAHEALSHEKIYLLKALDGRKRVVMGSANMSRAAFGGYQRENICYLDDDKAYEYYLDCYERLKEGSTDQITGESLALSDEDENIDKLPIMRSKKALVFQTDEDARNRIDFTLDVNNLAKKLSPSVPKPDKKGKLLLTPEKIRKIHRQAIEEKQREEEKRQEYPQLEILCDEQVARLNGTLLDLSPKKEEVQKDISLFLEYMAGFEKFHGDTKGLQMSYYKFFNWFFCSPFMARLRNSAERHNQGLLPYPVFGLVYGQSKAGKTSFLETLIKMMIGQKIKIPAPDFTRSSIENLKRTVEGVPIIVDDLTNTRFNQHAIETIKNESFGIAERLYYFPAVAISANEDVKAISPEIVRRTVLCRVQAGLTNTEVMRSNVVKKTQNQIGTAFFREYLRRMLEIMPDLLKDLENDEAEDAPDILASSSGVLTDIFKEYAQMPLPEYIRFLSLEDYFSEKETGNYSIKIIQNAWKTSRSSFVIDRQVDELRYNAGATYEADRIKRELPENLEAIKSRDWIMMNLTEAEKFFNIKFRKTPLSWLKDKLAHLSM